ncbi:suppressor of fused domain protein [Ruminococcus sp. HUN007]|uniref:suppressor of fused domain protein n=1 Tax=Ruminococcus sp. HUN007 TaxID=1514668 RepID=UPI000679A273|nr:suppressor of fused domain protein [Ruminococcus sp. HUN007]
MALNKYEEKMISVLTETLGGVQAAFSYQKQDAEHKLDILYAKQSPGGNYLTASTLGLVNRTTGYSDSNTGKEIRAEIIMSSYGGHDMAGKILSTAGIGIYDTNIRYGYGTVLKGIMELYYPNSDMKHLFLMLPPPLWKKSFGVTDADESIITFLYALPISQAECDYMSENGIDALQNFFVEKNIDMFDFERKSVL